MAVLLTLVVYLAISTSALPVAIRRRDAVQPPCFYKDKDATSQHHDDHRPLSNSQTSKGTRRGGVVKTYVPWPGEGSGGFDGSKGDASEESQDDDASWIEEVELKDEEIEDDGGNENNENDSTPSKLPKRIDTESAFWTTIMLMILIALALLNGHAEIALVLTMSVIVFVGTIFGTIVLVCCVKRYRRVLHNQYFGQERTTGLPTETNNLLAATEMNNLKPNSFTDH